MIDVGINRANDTWPLCNRDTPAWFTILVKGNSEGTCRDVFTRLKFSLGSSQPPPSSHEPQVIAYASQALSRRRRSAVHGGALHAGASVAYVRAVNGIEGPLSIETRLECVSLTSRGLDAGYTVSPPLSSPVCSVHASPSTAIFVTGRVDTSDDFVTARLSSPR